MAGDRKLTVVLAGDASGLQRAMGKAQSSAGKLGSKISTFGKVAAIGLGGAAIAGVAFGKSLVDAATESQKVTKQTEAVIKSMGGSANVTADQVAALSEKLAMQSGVDDELIQSGQNVLLTFGNIKNAIGDGPKVFDRATQAALDMSVALGSDMSSASMMVGKALNDPVKGLSKLARSGVQFSKQQEDQIKTMVKAGDTAGAQAIMLKELERQFGGSAKAQATAGERLQVVWGNLQEKLGEKLLPIIEKVASFLANNLPKAFDALGKVLGPIAAKVSEFWYTFTSGFTQDEGTGIERFALKVREVIGQVAAAVQQWVPRVIAGFQMIVGFVQQHWPEIQRIVVQVVQTIQTVVAGVVQTVTVLWQNFGNNILSFVKRVWPPILQIIKSVLTTIRGVIQVVTSLIKGDWSGVWNGIKAVFSGVWGAIQGIVKTALESIRLVVGAALEVVGSMFKGAWNGIVDFFKGVPGKIAAAMANLAEILTAPYRAAFSAIRNLWNDTIGGFGFEFGGWNPPGPGKVPGITFRIPEMHTGGIFNSGRGEGPALLKDGEGVFTPRQMAALAPAGGGPSVVVDLRGSFVASGIEFERIVRKAIADTVGRNGKIPGTNIVKATA